MDIVRPKKLIFRDFNEIKVSTKTFIIQTNVTLNIELLFNFLPITEFIVVPKKRGRKKKIVVIDPNKDLPDGSIINLKFQNNNRGADLKKKKKNTKKGNYFRNSVTIIMIIENKKINFKVSKNGKIQMTGCKSDYHSEQCVKWFWDYIKDNNEIYKNENNTKCLKAIIIPAMRNIDFGLNFLINREKLDEYFNTRTEFHSLLETSFGYTGVNIKIPVTKSINKLNLKQLVYENDKWQDPVVISYPDYLNTLNVKDKEKKLTKQRYNTFLVFHSGNVIMSGMEESFMKDVYYTFLDIIKDCYDIIEERLY